MSGTALPVLSIGDARVREAIHDFSVLASFEITLDSPAAAAVSVAWATANGGGPNPAAGFDPYIVVNGQKILNTSGVARQYVAFVADYFHDSGVVTFAPGETRRTVTVEVLSGPGGPDAPEESFTVVLSNPEGATIGKGVGIGTIEDSAVPLDTPPDIRVRDGVAAEPAGGGGAVLSFRVTLGHAYTGTVTVDYATRDGSATAGADYAPASGTLTFAPGDTTQYVSVAVAGDGEAEADETVVLELSNAAGGMIAAGMAIGTILDTSPLPPVPAGPFFSVTTDGVVSYPAAVAYSGPVAGLAYELVTGAGNDVVAGTALGDFINLKGGADAANGLDGDDVLDGGTGSNFLTGGAGTDRFFVDARELAETIWSTVTDLGPGEAVTFWGLDAAAFSLAWADDMGAAGFKGLTLVASQGSDAAALTLAGYTRADLAGGRLLTAFGHEPVSGSDYLYIHAV